MNMRRRAGRAAEYRKMAEASTILMATSTLGHVREKHELAAARWTALAELDERPLEAVTSGAVAIR